MAIFALWTVDECANTNSKYTLNKSNVTDFKQRFCFRPSLPPLPHISKLSAFPVPDFYNPRFPPLYESENWNSWNFSLPREVLSCPTDLGLLWIRYAKMSSVWYALSGRGLRAGNSYAENKEREVVVVVVDVHYYPYIKVLKGPAKFVYYIEGLLYRKFIRMNNSSTYHIQASWLIWFSI